MKTKIAFSLLAIALSACGPQRVTNQEKIDLPDGKTATMYTVQGSVGTHYVYVIEGRTTTSDNREESEGKHTERRVEASAQ